jgi:hypothetical protein
MLQWNQFVLVMWANQNVKNIKSKWKQVSTALVWEFEMKLL